MSRGPASPLSSLPSPFALLLDPEAIDAAVRRGNAMPLKRRVCRPLDRPGPGALVGRLGEELAALDAEIDAQEIEAQDDPLEAAAEPSGDESRAR